MKLKKTESLGAVYTRVNLKDRKFIQNITVGAIINRPQKEHGITLISLVVTIIILLILAGISIGLISGSNGILGKASSAVDTNDQAEATEKMEMKITYFNMISYGENTRKANLQELAEGMFQDKEVDYVKIKEQKVASLEAINVSGENSIFVKLKEYPYEFEIGNDLQLASVDGVKLENSDDKINTVLTEMEQMKSEISELKNTVSLLQNNNLQKSNLIKRDWGPASKTFAANDLGVLESVQLAGHGTGKAIISYSLSSQPTACLRIHAVIQDEKGLTIGDDISRSAQAQTVMSSCSGTIQYSENTVIKFITYSDKALVPTYTYSILLIPDEVK